VKVAVSNIAWPREWDTRIARTLADAGAEGIEVAPTRLWDDPVSVSDRAARECRTYWESLGLPIVSAQALLFGHPELVLFGSIEVRGKTLDYLGRILELCERLGATRAVFGSPRNRLRGDLDVSSADDIAAEFFVALADSAEQRGVVVALEANPPEYGCDYITRAAEALSMVRRVNSAGLRMHLDTGCMLLACDDAEAAIVDAADVLHHIHASEPQLAPVTASGAVCHREVADALRASGYCGWVSVEMRAPEVFGPTQLAASVADMVQAYGGAGGSGSKAGPDSPGAPRDSGGRLRS
jgi:D-psicose/D-tagatose/L-ribulose 3-epimerase